MPEEKINIRPTKVYVFLGVMGSGKTYYADKVAKLKGAARIDFKTTLVDMTYELLGLPENFDYERFKASSFKLEGVSEFTGREFLQRFGTDIMRNKVDQDFWCNALVSKIKNLPAGRIGDIYETLPVAIADCRFLNEVLALKNAGFDTEFYLTSYKSDRYNDKSSHQSEKLAQALIKKYVDIRDWDKPVDWCLDWRTGCPDPYICRLKDNFLDYV